LGAKVSRIHRRHNPQTAFLQKHFDKKTPKRDFHCKKLEENFVATLKKYSLGLLESNFYKTKSQKNKGDYLGQHFYSF